jgi:hypothetical protein
MSFKRAFQWYHSHADPIWPDGIVITSLFQALVGGDGITLQNFQNYDEIKPLISLLKLECTPCDEIIPLFCP